MSVTRFSLAISHAPWVPERVESMARLVKSLADSNNACLNSDVYRVFDEKAANHVWSEKMWRWASECDVDWCLFLQDDAVVAPQFWEMLKDITRRAGCHGVIGLQVAHPAAIALDEEGYSHFTSSDALVGVGYAIARDDLVEFLEWRATALNDGAVEKISEDTLIGLWCAVTGRLIYHPIPTIVDHDVTLQSTYGNDAHSNRRSRVRWDSLPKRVALPRDGIPHVGCFYGSTPQLAREYVKEIDAETMKRIVSDNGRETLMRLHYAKKARATQSPTRLFIATPMRGNVSATYTASVWRLLADEKFDPSASFEIVNVQTSQDDLVRVRSRFVSRFLNQTDATHLLFLDSDIEVPPWAIQGMIDVKRDFVCIPYPKRDGVDWDRVRQEGNRSLPAEACAYRYAFKPHDNTISLDPSAKVAEIDGIGLGCALLSRNMLERMSDFHNSEPGTFDQSGERLDLGFDDGEHGPSVALFQLILKDRALMSEDYSFCSRWRAMGGQIWMYLGPGSPANHYGEHNYKGAIEAFGLRRGT